MFLILQIQRPGSKLVPDANTNNTLFSGLKSRYYVCPEYTYTTLYKLSKCVHLFYHSWKSCMTTDSCFYCYYRQFLSRVATKNSAGGSSVLNGRLLFHSLCVRHLASFILWIWNTGTLTLRHSVPLRPKCESTDSWAEHFGHYAFCYLHRMVTFSVQ